MNSAATSKNHRRTVAILVAITIISRLALVFRPDWLVATRPFMEDSFYIFNVAEHLAHGQGLTVDGVHPTNGIQPLVAFVYAPCFAIAGQDRFLALRLCFIVVAICDVLSVLLIALLVRTLMRKVPDENESIWLSPPIFAAACWALLHTISTHTMNGLETGLYSMFLIASTLVYAKIRWERSSPTAWTWIFFGVLLGLTVLARIDAAFLVIAFALVEVIRYRKRGLVPAAIFSMTALLVSLPWWLYNQLVFGSLMPQSGQSEGMLSLLRENMARGAIVLGDIISITLILPNYSMPEWAHYAWFVVAILCVVLIVRTARVRQYLRDNASIGALLPLALFGAFCVVYYVFFFSAPHFLPRYFHPVRILWLVLVACSLPAVLPWLRSRGRVVWYGAAGIFLLSAAMVTGYGYSLHFLMKSPNNLFKAGQWAAAHPEARVGMGQSGLAGFVAPNVTNLDGKVNFDALQALKRHDIGGYIIRQNFDFIADWPEFSLEYVQAARLQGVDFQPFDSIGNVVIFKRVR